MSQLLYKYFLQKTNLDHIITVGHGHEDPYFEEIPKNELHFYQRKGAKRQRRLPDYIPHHDLKILNKVKNRAYTLDLQLNLCGFRIGWAGVIGLIPGIGDIIALYFALQLVNTAKGIDGGLPKMLEAQMQANVMFDFGIGLIPVVGDFINVLYKCNSRNFVLLEKHLVHKYGKGQNGVPGTDSSTKHGAGGAGPTTGKTTTGKTGQTSGQTTGQITGTHTVSGGGSGNGHSGAGASAGTPYSGRPQPPIPESAHVAHKV
ncbi:uncharacterized protein LODBEIA_P28850 [Lodderomyces beijingensis]|uniref:Uncharacterized protein n=1 Tax=Lodderomyces beijingensis TaxID=1775926 RepID=A0ABP0ZNG5_9ASCO